MVALLRGGALLSWGTGEQGQLGRVGAQLPERGLKQKLLTPAEVTLKRAAKAAAADPVVDIAAGNYSTFAVSQKGQVWAWGLNNYGQLAQEAEVKAYPLHYTTCLWDLHRSFPSTEACHPACWYTDSMTCHLGRRCHPPSV